MNIKIKSLLLSFVLLINLNLASGIGNSKDGSYKEKAGFKREVLLFNLTSDILTVDNGGDLKPIVGPGLIISLEWPKKRLRIFSDDSEAFISPKNFDNRCNLVVNSSMVEGKCTLDVSPFRDSDLII